MRKRILLLSLAGLLFLGAGMQGADTIEVPIIMYHSLAGAGKSGTSISGEMFEADLQYLRENGYTAVTLLQLVDFVHHGVPLPERPVVLTFDDGYWNNYSIGLPLAKAYDMPFVLSVIGRDTEIWSENPAESLRHGHVTWAQIQEMADSGLVEIANHTWDLHQNANGRKGAQIRPGESVAQYAAVLREDVGRLQTALAERVGTLPVSFVYPFGATCPEGTEVLREMGFLVTLSCYDGMNTLTQGEFDCLYDLRRYNRSPERSVGEILAAVESRCALPTQGRDLAGDAPCAVAVAPCAFRG